MNPIEYKRFLSHVDKNAYTLPHMNTPCWIWRACTNDDGYGKMRIGKKIDNKMPYTHRLSHEHYNGPLIEGLHINHACDNPPCVRPDHLWQGTPKEGVDDMVQKGRTWTGHSHLRESQVYEIRASYKTGEYTHASLAKKYHIGRRQIEAIVNNRKWIKLLKYQPYYDMIYGFKDGRKK